MKKKIFTLLLAVFPGAYCALQAQDFTYKGFVDFGFEAEEDGSGAFFGGFDNYINAQVTDRLGFVGEVIVERGEGQEFRLDVERIHATWDFNNYFKLKVGRFYSPVGYYTPRYFSDHAAIMAPSIERPDIIGYEDDGGMLETRASGIMFSGEKIGKLNFGYDLAITNGIAGLTMPGEEFTSHNKAGTVRLYLSPIEGLTFGGGGKYDYVDADHPNMEGDSLPEDMQNVNLSGFAAYVNKNLTIIGEYYSITNTSNELGAVHSEGAFGYVSYNIGKFTPYVQYNYVKVSERDMFYSHENNLSGLDVGLKYSFNYRSILRAEYHNHAGEFLLQYALGF
jgi:hypothetical protein